MIAPLRTKLVLSQTLLEKQGKLATLGTLAAGIAHEIRNPLTSIAGSVSMLSGIPEMNEDHRRLLDIVEPTPQTVDALMKLDLAAGVDVEIKI